MLEKIYVLLKNSDKYKKCKTEIEVFRKNMQAQGICVVCLEKRQQKRKERQTGAETGIELAAAEEGAETDTRLTAVKEEAETDTVLTAAEEEDGTQTEAEEEPKENCLLVTDFLPEEMAAEDFLYIVGYGLDYKGNVPYIIDDLEKISAGYMRLIYSRYLKIPYTVAVTERLVIREMRLEDLDDMYAVYDSLSGCPYIEPLYERSREEEFTRNYIRDMYGFYQYGLWLVFDRKSGEIVGRVGIENRMIDGQLCRELGYLIDKKKQGMGYAYEASLAVLDYARSELELEEMYICAHINNKSSICLARKLGFTLYAENIDGINLYRKQFV